MHLLKLLLVMRCPKPPAAAPPAPAGVLTPHASSDFAMRLILLRPSYLGAVGAPVH